MPYPKYSKVSRKKHAMIFYQEHTDVFRANSTSVVPPSDICEPVARHEVFSLTQNESWELSSISRLTKYYSGDQIEKKEMGGTCSRYWGEERFVQGFDVETGLKDSTWKTQV